MKEQQQKANALAFQKLLNQSVAGTFTIKMFYEEERVILWPAAGKKFASELRQLIDPHITAAYEKTHDAVFTHSPKHGEHYGFSQATLPEITARLKRESAAVPVLRKPRPGDKKNPFPVGSSKPAVKNTQKQKNHALIKAINTGDVANMKRYLSEADPECKVQGRTALIWAAEKAFEEGVRLLLTDERVSVHSKTGDGNTALHSVVSSIQVERDEAEKAIMTLLLEHDADINATNAKGMTALHEAVLFNKVHLITLLRERGADLSLKNTDGKTPSDLALVSDSGAVRDAIKVENKTKNKSANLSKILAASEEIAKIGRFLHGDTAIAYLAAMGVPAVQAMELPYDEPKRKDDDAFYIERLALKLMRLEAHVAEEQYCPKDVTKEEVDQSFDSLKNSFLSVFQQRITDQKKFAELKQKGCDKLIEALKEEHSQMSEKTSFAGFVVKKVALVARGEVSIAINDQQQKAYKALQEELLRFAKATVYRKVEFTSDPITAWGRVEKFSDAKKNAISKDVETFSKLWDYYKIQSEESEQKAASLAKENNPKMRQAAIKKLRLGEDENQSVFIVVDGPRGALPAADYGFSAFQRLYEPGEAIKVNDLYVIANDDNHWVMHRFRFNHEKKTIERLMVDSAAKPGLSAALFEGERAEHFGRKWLKELQGPLTSYSVTSIQTVTTYQQLNDRVRSRDGKVKQSTCLLYSCENAKKLNGGGVAIEDLGCYTMPEKEFRHGASVITKIFAQGAPASETALPQKLTEFQIKKTRRKRGEKGKKHPENGDRVITPPPTRRRAPIAPSKARAPDSSDGNATDTEELSSGEVYALVGARRFSKAIESLHESATANER